MSEIEWTSNREPSDQTDIIRLPMILGILTLLIVAGYLLFSFLSLNSDMKKEMTGYPVAAPRSYAGRTEYAKPVQPQIENDTIKLRLDIVDQLNIVEFEWKNKLGALVPVVAYISSSGRLFVGSGQCACEGRHFLLADETLVCDNCRTTYSIEDQKFLSGKSSAANNPPSAMKYVLKNGMILIPRT